MKHRTCPNNKIKPKPTRRRPKHSPGLSDWIERTVHLPQGLAAEPGRVKLWPYQRAIADAITDSALERVTLVKSVRIGLAPSDCGLRRG
jgi:phage terminase large subunit GpA-like protein